MIAAVGLALLSTYRHRPVADRAVRGISYLGFGTPPFFVALILLIVFFSTLHILPGPEGRLAPTATPPPTVTHLYTVDALLAGQFGTFWRSVRASDPSRASRSASLEFSFLVRLLRANLLEVSREPFLTVARGKGLPRWRAFRRHALPNAFLPTLTVGWPDTRRVPCRQRPRSNGSSTGPEWARWSSMRSRNRTYSVVADVHPAERGHVRRGQPDRRPLYLVIDPRVRIPAVTAA